MALGAALVGSVLGCQGEDDGPVATAEPLGEGPIFAALPSGVPQLIAVCQRLQARGASHALARAFCASGLPVIRGITDVHRLLGLEFKGPVGVQAQLFPNDNPGFALTAHSSSLSRRLASPINPRAIVMTQPGTRFDAEPGFVVTAFTRGERFVEIMVHDATLDAVEFFLLRFEQPCDTAPAGCTPTDLHTERTEQNWSSWTLYDETDLRNTIFDCAVCHEHGYRDAAVRRKGPLMFELNGLWPHWLYNNGHFPGWEGRPEGPGPFHENLFTYVAAHETEAEPISEPYSGIPGPNVFESRPMSLEDLIEGNGFGNGFDRSAYRDKGRGDGMNDLGDDILRTLARAGLLITPPAKADNPFEPGRLAAAVAALKAHRTGAAPELADITDVFDPESLHLAGLGVHPGASAPEILVEACTQCHHEALDQSVTRARFSLELPVLSDVTVTEAIRRLELPATHHKAMPPHRLRELLPAERERVVAWLRQVLATRANQRPVKLPRADFERAPRGMVGIGPASGPVGANAYLVVMSAAEPVVDAAPVEYRFEAVEERAGATSSKWQISPLYVDTGLQPGVGYRYRVVTRVGEHLSEASDEVSVTLELAIKRCYGAPGLSPLAIELDADCDTVPNTDETGKDTDGDEVPNDLDTDDDNDGIPTSSEASAAALHGGDPDGDGVPPWLDDDSDGDGKLDAVESGGDFDGDGIHNFIDPLD